MVTIREIAESGERFDNQMIMVSGVFKYDFEDVAIYQSGWYKQKEQALWLRFNKNSAEKFSDDYLESIENSRIEVIGILDMKKSGHLGQYLAELELICIVE